MRDVPQNAGYMAAAYIVTAVILLGYAISRYRRRPRTRGRTAPRRRRGGRRDDTDRPPRAPHRDAPRARAPARTPRAHPAGGTPSATLPPAASRHRDFRESAARLPAPRPLRPTGPRWRAAVAPAPDGIPRTSGRARRRIAATGRRVWALRVDRPPPAARRSGRARSAGSGALWIAP